MRRLADAAPDPTAAELDAIAREMLVTADRRQNGVLPRVRVLEVPTRKVAVAAHEPITYPRQ